MSLARINELHLQGLSLDQIMIELSKPVPVQVKSIDYSDFNKALSAYHTVHPPKIKFDKKKAKLLYYRLVWKITLSHDLEKLMNGHKRGFRDHHIDHIIPISYGFKNCILPQIIGGIDNLRPLYYRENMEKGQRLIGC